MEQNLRKLLPEFRNNVLPSTCKSWTIFVETWEHFVQDNKLTIVKIVETNDPQNVIYYIDWEFALLQRVLESQQRPLIRGELWPRFKEFLGKLF